jgi:hypothetical protein
VEELGSSKGAEASTDGGKIEPKARGGRQGLMVVGPSLGEEIDVGEGGGGVAHGWGKQRRKP